MLELVYRMVSKTIALSGLRVQVPSPVKYLENLLKSRFFVFGEAGKLLCLRRDLKGAAMFLFARVKGAPFAQGKNREPGLQENSVRNFTGRQGHLR